MGVEFKKLERSHEGEGGVEENGGRGQRTRVMRGENSGKESALTGNGDRRAGDRKGQSQVCVRMS